jgi:general secretion pathway protein D
MIHTSRNWLTASLLALLLAGCATDDLLGRKPTATENLSESRQKLEQNPKDKAARVQEVNALYNRINQLQAEADEARQAGNADEARRLYREVLQLDPNYPRAINGLRQMEMEERHQRVFNEAKQLFDAGNLDGARTKLRPVLIENPAQADARSLMQAIEEKTYKDLITPRKLKPAKSSTVTLEFRDASLRSVFDVISRTSGINFVLDPTIRPDLKASIFVKDASVEETIDFLLLTHQLSKKVLTENSLLVYPQNRAAQYEDLTLRTYYLNHADAKQTATFIKSMLGIKEMHVDEKLNMISVKAPFEMLRNVERLIADSDVPDPEVMLDVEVLEINRSRLTDLGIKYPDTFTVLSPGEILTWDDLRNIDSQRIGVFPSPTIRLLREDGDSNLLANPRIRVKNREKAKIHIGQKIPIESTTIGENSGVRTSSANYLDVGLKLDVEPRVMLNNDVSIKINLEVSSSTQPAGADFPTIFTRNTSTTLMSGDNETQVLAGLINDEDRKNVDKVPGLGDIPIIGRLFSKHRDDRTKTEIVLLITPHVVRNVLRPEAGDAEFYGGTGGARSGPININPAAVLQQFSGVPAGRPAAPAAAPAAPAAPAENKAPEIPEGAPRPIGRPVGQE